MASETAPKILVIKHGAAEDFLAATGAFKAIRAHHPRARISLLTPAGFAELGAACGAFDEVVIDPSPEAASWKDLWQVAKYLWSSRFTHIYDFENSDQTALYGRLLLWRRPIWVRLGIAAGRHPADSYADALRIAGIAHMPRPDISWLSGDVSQVAVRPPFALLFPGEGRGEPRPGQHFPAPRFGKLANWIAERGLQPVVIGLPDRREMTDIITFHCPAALNLTGQVTLSQVAELSRHADFAIGENTLPLHLAATANCRTLVLFAEGANPVAEAPRGALVVTLQRPALDHLPIEDIEQALQTLALAG